jgi:hypothetical protein
MTMRFFDWRLRQRPVPQHSVYAGNRRADEPPVERRWRPRAGRIISSLVQSRVPLTVRTCERRHCKANRNVNNRG